MADRRPVVLSVEQALSMSYATLRFAHLGWRVIRIEPTPSPGLRTRGDPNRHIGRKVAEGDRHSYFVGPNCGKEAIALNLKEPDGQALLARLIRELRADVFCTNTMPARHASLGIDYASLSKLRPELVWCCISAMGLAYPNVPGYDPVLQAQCGYMDVTGYPDGPPMQNGPPLIDLKAGDEAFAQVLWAMLERHRTGAGRAIDVSMAQVATSWLLTFLPMLDMGSPPEELKRSGNEHRQFIPTNAYPTADGFIYMAVGSDVQWQRLVAEAPFRSLDRPDLATNEGRRRDKTALHAAIAALTGKLAAAEVAKSLRAAQIPHAPITPIERVMDQDFLKDALLRTHAPDGKSIRLPPPAVSTDFLESQGRELRFAPAYGEHTHAVLSEVGVPSAEIASLKERGVIA
ncbi:MAG: CoA transferase [Myxococcales bacterium]|nr:CoA transferase [Myxococcales bacterium]